jgi:hypothetical protein
VTLVVCKESIVQDKQVEVQSRQKYDAKDWPQSFQVTELEAGSASSPTEFSSNYLMQRCRGIKVENMWLIL